MSQLQATGASKRLLVSVAENQNSFSALLEKEGSANGVVLKLNNTGKEVRRRVFFSKDSKYLQWEPSKKKEGFGESLRSINEFRKIHKLKLFQIHLHFQYIHDLYSILFSHIQLTLIRSSLSIVGSLLVGV